MKVFRRVLVWTLDIVGIAGVVYAAYLWHEEVGFAVAGVGLIALSITIEWSEKRNRNESASSTT